MCISFLSEGGATESLRKRRWSEFNNVLVINRKGKIRDGRIPSTEYSYANWEQVKGFFHVVPGNIPTTLIADGLSEDVLIALQQYLSFATICLESCTAEHEPSRIPFISSIILMVGSYFNGDVKISANEEISSSRLRFYGRFDFILRRGNHVIFLVEAKKDDILQGKTQCLLGCESLCDVEEDLTVAYGISTNYYEWCFLKNEADRVTEEMVTVQLVNGRPTIDSLRCIVNKIIAVLQA